MDEHPKEKALRIQIRNRSGFLHLVFHAFGD